MNGNEEVGVKVDKLSDLHHRGLLRLPNQREMNTTTNIMVVVEAV